MEIELSELPTKDQFNSADQAIELCDTDTEPDGQPDSDVEQFGAPLPVILFPSLAGTVLECHESPVAGYKGSRIWMEVSSLLAGDGEQRTVVCFRAVYIAAVHSCCWLETVSSAQ